MYIIMHLFIHILVQYVKNNYYVIQHLPDLK